VADWNSGHEITDEMEPPPERLCQPGGSEDKRLAEVWPFDR